MIKVFESNFSDPEPWKTNSFEINFMDNQLILNQIFNDPKSTVFESQLMENSQSYKFDFIERDKNIFKFSWEEGVQLRDLTQLTPQQYLAIYTQLLQIVYELHRSNNLARCISTKTVYLTGRGQIKLLEFGFYPMLPRNINFQYDEYLDIYLIGLIMKELYSLLKQKTRQVEKLYQLITQISQPEYYKVKSYEKLQLVLENPKDEIIQYYKSLQFKQNALIIQFNIQKRELNANCLLLDEINSEVNGIINQSQLDHIETEPISKATINDLMPPSDLIDTTQEIDLGQVIIDKRNRLFIYRFTVMDETVQQLSQLKQQIQPQLVICFILKVKIIVSNQLLQDLQNNVNVLQISQTLWERFVQQKENQQLIDKLLSFQQRTQQDFNSHFGLLKNMILQHQETYLIPQGIQQKLNSESNFEGIKFPFRECINEFLASVTFSNLDNLFKSKLTLRLTLCMIINKAFDFDNLNITFRKIIKYWKLQSLEEDFSLIAKFISKATNQQLFDVAEDIRQLYFGTQQVKQR